MAETLEIQILDKGSVAPSAGAAPPRAPAFDNPPAPARQRSAPPSAVSSTPTVHPAAKEKLQESIVETILDRLGFDKELRAFRELFDYIAKRAAPTPAAAPVATALPAPPTAIAAPVATALPAPQTPQAVAAPPLPSAATMPVNAPALPVEPMVRTLEQGFGRIASILQPMAEHFAELPTPGPAVPASEKKTVLAPPELPAPRAAHAPASAGLQHPQAMPSAVHAPPRPPAAPQLLPAPAAAKEPPRPPLAAAALPAPKPAAIEAAGGAEAAAGAEAAGGALAGVAATALPIAAAFVAVDAAIKLTEFAFDAARESVEFMGHEIAEAAGNNYLGMFKGGLDHAEKSLAKVPIVGGMLSSAFGAAVAPVRAFTEVTEAFTKRAHELAGFSPQIAMAEQMAGVRSMLDDFKEADTLGPDLARMLEAESSINHELREIFLPIKKVMTDVVATVLEYIGEALRDIHGIMAAIKELVGVGIELLNDIFGGGKIKDIPDLIKSIPDRIAKAIQEANSAKEDDDALKRKLEGMTRDLLDSHWDKGAAADPWGGVQRDARPNIPGVQSGFAGL